MTIEGDKQVEEYEKFKQLCDLKWRQSCDLNQHAVNQNQQCKLLHEIFKKTFDEWHTIYKRNIAEYEYISHPFLPHTFVIGTPGVRFYEMYNEALENEIYNKINEELKQKNLIVDKVVFKTYYFRDHYTYTYQGIYISICDINSKCDKCTIM